MQEKEYAEKLEYTAVISSEEYRELVEKAATAELCEKNLRQRWTRELAAKNKAWAEVVDLKGELERTRRELETAKNSSDFWHEKALELGYLKVAGEG